MGFRVLGSFFKYLPWLLKFFTTRLKKWPQNPKILKPIQKNMECVTGLRLTHFLPEWIFLWAVRFDFEEKFFPQFSQTCLASPECMCSMWDSRLVRWPKSLLQNEQLKGLLGSEGVERTENKNDKGLFINDVTQIWRFSVYQALFSNVIKDWLFLLSHKNAGFT